MCTILLKSDVIDIIPFILYLSNQIRGCTIILSEWKKKYSLIFASNKDTYNRGSCANSDRIN